MKTFADLEFKPRAYGLSGVQGRQDYPNGYGVSVVKGHGTYGEDSGLWEVAVFKDGNLCYETPITDDVIGHCSEEEVTRLMGEIQALPKPQATPEATQ